MKRKSFIKILAGIPVINLMSGGVLKAGDAEVPCKTESDVEGPFYKANAPSRSVIETEGQPLYIEGRIYSADCKTPVANATLDIWHCDNEGAYDMEGYKGRAQIEAAADGTYKFTTIFPPPYGSRPRHIHFKIRAKGRPELTTQLYFSGDPNIENDFARNAERDRVISLVSKENMQTGVFNIYV